VGPILALPSGHKYGVTGKIKVSRNFKAQSRCVIKPGSSGVTGKLSQEVVGRDPMPPVTEIRSDAWLFGD